MRFAGSKKVSDFLGNKADWAGMGATSVMDAAENSANTALNNARAADAKMGALAKVEAAGHWADATKAAGQAQGQASMVSGIAGGIGGLGGLFSGGGGGSSFGSMGSGNSYGGFSRGMSFQQSQPSLYGFGSLG